MNEVTGKVFVWPLCTRIIHWIIASSFTFSFITSFNKEYFILHIAFGYVFGVVLSFRIIWGFVGPKYATFNTFKLRFLNLKEYFAEKMKDRWRKSILGTIPHQVGLRSLSFCGIYYFFGWYAFIWCTRREWSFCFSQRTLLSQLLCLTSITYLYVIFFSFVGDNSYYRCFNRAVLS